MFPHGNPTLKCIDQTLLEALNLMLAKLDLTLMKMVTPSIHLLLMHMGKMLQPCRSSQERGFPR